MKNVMKRVIVVIMAAAMVIGCVACGSSSANNTTAPAAETKTEKKEEQKAAEPAPVEAAEEISGKVVIYTSMYEDIIEMLDGVLAEKFPNCDIEFFYGGTGTLQSKVAAEMDAGQLGCDMLMVAEPAYSLELKEKNYLHQYKTPEAENLSFAYDADGYWYPVRVCTMVLAYNPDLYTKDEIATTFDDFAKNPDLKGYISMSNPLSSGTAMAAVTALEDKYGVEYFDELAANEVTVESGSVALTKLETGECKEVMILEESVIKKREEEGSLLECIYPDDGVISVPSTIMTIDESKSANKNIAACETITDWFLSEEGQSYILKGWMHSVRKDCTSAPYDSLTNDVLYQNVIDVDWERCYKERDQIRTDFEERITVE